MKSEYLRVGVISSAHGIKGEVNVFPTCDDPERFKQLEFVFTDEGKNTLTIENVKFFKNMVIIKFKEIPDRNAAERFRNKDIFVDRAHAQKLAENEYFISDILGAEVVTDEGETLGTLTDVLQTGANDVYEIELKNGKKVYFPVIKECVLDIDTDNCKVTVHVMPGLM